MKKLFLLLVLVFGMVHTGLSQASSSPHATGVHTPIPPYPAEALKAKAMGSGTCQVAFDAAGHVGKMVMTKSTGSKILDENTLGFARKHWTGPANTKVVVPVKYVLTLPAKKANSGTCQVAFDGSGHAKSATMIQSTGSKILDQNTVSYALKNWTGTPNTTEWVPIAYSLR